MIAALVSALGCRGHDGEPRGQPAAPAAAPAAAPELPMPAVRPPDFALRLRYHHGSGMQLPVEATIVGAALSMSEALNGDDAVTIALGDAQLDAVYAAARRLPAAAVRPARPQASDLDEVRIEIVAAAVTRTIDSALRATDPADHALLDLLRGLVADARRPPDAGR